MRKAIMALGLLLVAVAGGAIGQLAVRRTALPHTSAAWIYRAPDLQSLIRYADATVLVTLKQVVPGRTAGAKGGGRSLQFELNTFEVHRILNENVGRLPNDTREIVVERATALGDAPLGAYDGGTFELGKYYVLMLKRQRSEPFAFYLVNDEARLELTASGRVVSAGRGRVAAELGGRTIGYVEQIAAAVTR